MPQTLKSVKIFPSSGIKGRVGVPADKSISHRLAIFAALAKGKSKFKNYLNAQDTQSTLSCLKKLGVAVTVRGNFLEIESQGHLSFTREAFLDCGNSGTSARLLMGALAGIDGTFSFDGDGSLRRRPMDRVVQPLTLMGARFTNTFMPLKEKGSFPLRKIPFFRSPIASAQVKSAVLLAALSAEGETVYEEPYPTRDHTERLLPLFGVQLHKEGSMISLTGPQQLKPATLEVPGDISSACFLVTLGVLLKESEIRIKGVGLNPTRMGFLEHLRKMGACINWETESETPEPRGSVHVAYSPELEGEEISAEQAVQLIDELPLLAVVATQARGMTKVSGAQELRLKESDRIRGIVQGLTKMGASISEQPDGFIVEGPTPLRGTDFLAFNDHRLTMAFAVAACAATSPSTFASVEDVCISFPSFFSLLQHLGVHVEA